MRIPLRTDFDAHRLRAVARHSKTAGQARRLLALAAIYDGASRTEAAAIGGVTLQIVRDWVLRLNAHGPDGLIDRKPPGQPSRLTDIHRAALAAVIESGPIPAVHGAVATVFPEGNGPERPLYGRPPGGGRCAQRQTAQDARLEDASRGPLRRTAISST